MASRTGPRAAGTDGSDFVHREVIELRHRISSVLKPRVRVLCFVHSLLLVLAGVRVFAQPKGLPDLARWELAWLASGLAPMAALLGLPRNRARLLRASAACHVICGLAPVGWAVFSHAADLHDFINTKRDHYSLPWGGLPYTPALFLFLSVCAQVHGFGIYYCWRLLRAWAPKPVATATAANANANAKNKKRS